MQSIAFELGIAETAYLTPTDDPTTFGLRWFSPAVEIDLCGHATLASAHALREGGVRRRHGAADLPHPQRPAARRLRRRQHRARLPGRPRDARRRCPTRCAEQWPGAVVASGRTDFFTFVVLSSAEAVRAYEPDLAAIAATGAKALLLTAAAAPGSGADYVLRVFGPNVGHRRGPRHRVGPVLGRPVLGGRAGARRPGRPPALPARCDALRAPRRGPGRASRGTPPRCSPASCARDSDHGESDDGRLYGGPASPGRGPRAGVAA